MKKILFLTPYVPSSRAGGENFTRLLLEQLSHSFHVDLLYFRYADDPIYESPNDNIKVVKEIVNSTGVKILNFLRYPIIHPIYSIRFNRSLLRYIRKIVDENKYNLIYLDHSQMALYGKYFPNIKKILMSHDVMAQRFSRQGNRLNWKLIVSGEKKIMCQPNTIVFSFSEKDRKIIKNYYGIDSKVTNFFLDDNLVSAEPTDIQKRFVFLGKWKRSDNFNGLKWFFDYIYQQVDKTIEIVIIGKWLPEDFQKKISSYDNVKYLGFVKNPYQIIANSLATISPLFSGAGVKVKVVESLACGTPVIGTNIAFEGIPSKYSNMMLLADNYESYQKAMDINISIEERKRFKQEFITDYTSETIPQFISKLLK